MTLFKNRYRPETARLAGWDYSSAGYYFVTICTHERACFLGEVCDGSVIPSPQGIIVAEEWRRTEAMRETIRLDEWVIMPNHLHGIIIIRDMRDVETPGVLTRDVETHDVETHCNASLRREQGSMNKFGPQRNNLASIIRGFKGCVTRRARALDLDFAWQPRYHDHIIRDEAALENIREYIVNNPLRWTEDENNPVNLL